MIVIKYIVKSILLKGGYVKKIMKKLLCLMSFVMLMFAVTPFVIGQATGGVGVVITPIDEGPGIWSCADRVIVDDPTNPGRSTTLGDLSERTNNYAFEGESIEWTVLVMDESGIAQVTSVEGTLGTTQGIGNAIEVGCTERLAFDPDGDGTVGDSCNAVLNGNSLSATTFDSTTMRYYDCILTIETAASHAGENFLTVEATSGANSAIVAENEFWFLNPTVGLTVTGGDLTFADVRPGTVSYSNTLVVENDAQDDSGVLLDMFISGTDFFDGTSTGAVCPTSNTLGLGNNFAEAGDSNEATGLVADLDDVCSIDLTSAGTGDHFCYYASSGAYSTENDIRSDVEGYVPIVFATAFTSAFYNDAEIIGGNASIPSTLTSIGGVSYYSGNVLSPGAEIAMTFKLGLPEPCVGTFDDGDIFFWGEAI